MQRLRLKFSRGEEVKFLSHLDLIRLWERALRRAEVPLAYSEGFTPHPRLCLAAPLPTGVTSEAELMDVWLKRWLAADSFVALVKRQLPSGISISDIWVIGLNVPSLQSQVRLAEYRVEIESEKTEGELKQAVSSLMSTKELPWQHSRDVETRHYDLRALIDDLWLISHQDSQCVLGMRLRCDSQGSGRPEQVTVALGFHQYPKIIHRTKLILGER